jgi:hypothetical protein
VHLERHHLVALPADQALGDWVEEVDAPLGVGADDRVADAGERDPEALALAIT